MDLVQGLQRARMMALLRRVALSAPDAEIESDALLLVGLAVGLVFAARHPGPAAAMLVELEPPDLTGSLDWVVHGSPHPDPNLPTH